MATTIYLVSNWLQVEAGAQMVQVFESHAEFLGPGGNLIKLFFFLKEAN
jgi:hypothetical protein